MSDIVGQKPHGFFVFDGANDDEALEKCQAAMGLIAEHERGVSDDNALLGWLSRAINLLGVVMGKNQYILTLQSIVDGKHDSKSVFDVFGQMENSILALHAKKLLTAKICELSHDAISRWVEYLEKPFES